MQPNQDYKQLLTEVIKKQIVILGPDITLSKARNVKGLTVAADGTVTNVDGSPQEVTQALIDEFVQLSGLIVKKTMEPLLSLSQPAPQPAPTPSAPMPSVQAQPIPPTEPIVSPIQTVQQQPTQPIVQPAQAIPAAPPAPMAPSQTQSASPQQAIVGNPISATTLPQSSAPAPAKNPLAA